MAENKTKPTEASVSAFLATVSSEKKRQDCETLISLFSQATGLAPQMWGPAIIGFGSYHYRYDSGREGDAPLAGFSPRAANISLYLSSHFENRESLLQQLGKHKSAKACVYIQKIEDIHTDVLTQMIQLSVAHIKKLYPNP
ncbi:DUF1801 domain-containing protein [Flavobacterium sp. XGLA_31]|uniref:DUF1801 domain-containing protein n=1 Tax=Flavobacterium sp. XGLA_31 TaxID=3447666 RepID=UPI003F367D7B